MGATKHVYEVRPRNARVPDVTSDDAQTRSIAQRKAS
jgi:hypothetical protein